MKKQNQLAIVKQENNSIKYDGLVKKRNDLVRGRVYAESVWEMRMFDSIVAKVRTDDTDFKMYEISVKDMMIDSEKVDSRTRKEIDIAIDRVMNSKVMEILDQDGDIGKFLPFIFCKFKKGTSTIQMQIHPLMIPYLIDLQKKFTIYLLEDFLRLKTYYSQRLFQILSSWKNKEEGFIDISLKTIHYQLNTTESYSKNFDFLNKLLQRCQKDIQGRTSLKFEYKPLRKKGAKKVIAIRFVIDAKKYENYTKTKASPIANNTEKSDNDEFFLEVSGTDIEIEDLESIVN